jgi:hypothetical protein
MKSPIVVVAVAVMCAPLFAEESPLDALRVQAAARFGPTLVSIRQEVDRTDTARRHYELACHGKVTTVRPVYPQGIPLDHAPTVEGALVSGIPPATTGGYATPLRFEISNESTAECIILRADIIAGVKSVEHRLADVTEAARKAGIYPGVMRDLRSANGLPID